MMELRGEGDDYRGPNEWDVPPLMSALAKRPDGTFHEISGATEQLYAQLMDYISGNVSIVLV